LEEWPGWSRQREEAAEKEVRESAYEIIEKKGSTNHAIGLVTANLVRGMLRNERRVLTVSRVQEGACGIEDLALSLPTIVGAGGAEEVLEPDLNPAERSGLERSAEMLREALESVS
jgi:L-lactate dehydrogenase